jgi:putative oxidoreductase
MGRVFATSKAVQLGLSICFILGLFGRVSALVLLIMAMVIQWLAGQTPQGIEHSIARDAQLYWMALFALFALIGPGAWSMDRWRAGRGRGQ